MTTAAMPEEHRSTYTDDMGAPRRVLRFPRAYRIEHWIAVASFTTLAITGLVQRFATSDLSKAIIAAFGGIESVRVIHRVAAVVLMLEVVYHIGVVGYRVFVRRSRLSMLPTLNDVRAGFGTLLYNLGLRKTRPQQGRFTAEEKLEYWAFAWGTIIMVVTGFMLWNPIATTNVLPGEFIPAAKAAHGNEALLAVLSVVLWHMYHVHVRHFNRSMFTGYATEHEMLTEHPLELADLKAGVAERPVDAEAVAARRRVFFPVYGALAALMLVGIYFFVTFEETAIATVPPPEDVVVFAPLTPTPFPTAMPTSTAAAQPPPQAAPSWDGNIAALFEGKCSACHGSTKLGGLDLSTYESTLAGGNSGPAVVPGDPDASVLIDKQAAGNHPGQLSDDELALVRTWIEAGAPQE
jgi:cytochrome b subunit of formate dehydrogenase/mono/diheme cytochrome c family protein